MKIYVVIPYHGENKSNYDDLLSSLNNQVEIDYNNFIFIFARSDGGEIFPSLSDYPNLVGHSIFLSDLCALSGPGQSRQIGIDYAMSHADINEDRIIFMDIDDRLVATNSLFILYGASKAYNDTGLIIFPQEYFSLTLNAVIDTGVPPCMHVDPQSKCYKLSFIKEKDLHFPRTFTTCEDCFWEMCLYAYPYWALHARTAIYQYKVSDGHETSTAAKNRALPKEVLIDEWNKLYDEFNDWSKNKQPVWKSEFFRLQMHSLNWIITRLKREPSPDIETEIKKCQERLLSDIEATKSQLKLHYDIIDGYPNSLKSQLL